MSIGAFYIDANAVDGHGRVGTTLASAVDGRDTTTWPRIGDNVLAVDADDNVTGAVVVDRQGQWLQVQLGEPMTALPYGDDAVWVPQRQLDRLLTDTPRSRPAIPLTSEDTRQSLLARLKHN